MSQPTLPTMVDTLTSALQPFLDEKNWQIDATFKPKLKQYDFGIRNDDDKLVFRATLVAKTRLQLNTRAKGAYQALAVCQGGETILQLNPANATGVQNFTKLVELQAINHLKPVKPVEAPKKFVFRP